MHHHVPNEHILPKRWCQSPRCPVELRQQPAKSAPFHHIPHPQALFHNLLLVTSLFPAILVQQRLPLDQVAAIAEPKCPQCCHYNNCLWQRICHGRVSKNMFKEEKVFVDLSREKTKQLLSR